MRRLLFSCRWMGALLLMLMDRAALHPSTPQAREPGQVRAGLAHVRRHTQLAVPLVMMAIIGCNNKNEPSDSSASATRYSPRSSGERSNGPLSGGASG